MDLLIKNLNEKYSNLVIAGSENGYVKDKAEAYKKVEEAKPDIVLVALGIPNQELLIYNNLDKFDKGIFIGVGGSFDVLSGMKKRAPKFFIKTHLEWFYRIMTEPKRLKRFFKSNIRYMSKIEKEKKV